MCVTMLDMKRATVREVQHNLAGVLRWIEDGEEVHIFRRDRMVARLVPPQRHPAPEWPDFAARAKTIWRRPVRGTPISQIISDDRDDRL